MFQAYRKKQTTTNWRKQMTRPEGKATGTGIFKHQDTRYMTWLKDQLDRRETMGKFISYRNDIEAHKRVNYRNQIDKMDKEMQRDNLNHNSIDHLQHQINQFKKLSFT